MRVVMIHALAESIPPVRLAFKDEFPEAEVINLLDEGLLIDFPGSITPGQDVQIRAAREDGSSVDFSVTCRIDNPVEVDYHRNGGVLHTVLRRMLREG